MRWFMVALAISACALTFASEEEIWMEENGAKSYKGHALVRFTTESKEQKAAFDQAVAEFGLDVWNEVPGKHGVARVPPSVVLAQVPLAHTVLHDDIETLFIEERKAVGTGFHQSYHSAAEVEAFLQDLAHKYPQWVHVERVATSTEGRPISAAHVMSAAPSAPIIFVQSGQHAREWIGPASALFMLEQAAAQAAKGQGLSGYQLTVVPLVNPDGYQYTHDKDRMWRKNRNNSKKHVAQIQKQYKKKSSFMSPAVFAAETTGALCVGVDLNRQWATHWATTMHHGKEVKDTPRPCSETFSGFAASHEAEVHGVSKYISTNKQKIQAFLDVHSYSQRLLPPGCNGYPISEKDQHEHMRVGRAIAVAMSHSEIQYTTGKCAEEMYTCSGTAADWTYHEANILHSYSLELRPTNKIGLHEHGGGFVVSPAQIEATGQELLAGVTSLAKQAL